MEEEFRVQQKHTEKKSQEKKNTDESWTKERHVIDNVQL